MEVKCFWEHNGEDTILWAVDYPGAFTRGSSLEEAKRKMPKEVVSYISWRDGNRTETEFNVVITQDKVSDLDISDADSDAIFENETLPMTVQEYEFLKSLALKSAADFLTLYKAIPEKDVSCLPERDTFYGKVPRTAEEMYEHTKNVNSYYFGEIGVECGNDVDILSCRKYGFNLLERQANFLKNKTVEGSYGESWSVKKVLRRFIWHDRIHAKAMYRMAMKTFGQNCVPDVFYFE